MHDREASRLALRRAFNDPEPRPPSHEFLIAVFAAHYGDLDLAFAALRKRFVETPTTDMFLLWWPFENDLHADPRFKQIVLDLGLVDYWRRSGDWGDFCKPAGDEDFQCR